MLHHGPVGRVQNKECDSVYICFFGFVAFHHTICFFIISSMIYKHADKTLRHSIKPGKSLRFGEN